MSATAPPRSPAAGTPAARTAAVSRGKRLRPAGLAGLPRPLRALVIASFVSSTGLGLLCTGSSVYFVRSVGLSAVEVGAGLSVAGLLGLAGGLAAGYLSDRLGASAVTVALRAATIPLILALTQARSFWAFAAVTGALGILGAGSDVSRSAWVAEVAGPGELSKVSAWSRSAFNAGFSLGLLGAGAAIAVGTRTAYLCMFAGDAAAMAGSCLMLARLPRVPAAMSTPGARRRPWLPRDLPYLVAAQVSGLTRLGDTILTVGLPLWLITRTSAPRGLAAWLIVLNTVVVVLFQGRATRRAATLAGATVIQRRAFAVFAAACLAAGLTAGLPAAPAIAVLLAVTLLLTVGEMWGEGAWWALRYGLAPAGAQGRYGGVFMLGQAAPTALGPVAVTAVTVTMGALGWLILAAAFLGCASFSAPALAWAQRAMHPRLAPP